ncbi:hypothetical protein [Geobacter sp. SVR]|uniref:hypothetical protein n=1 Tax=Geobacter sp. SVR TaxID=2495594 RepID=UPI00143EFE6F|nr:hypothetical protein [Geobacter sp. SVR]BCS52279.1 hypothetical protein GSVR_05870 [Geobacter sp. SVR]GCF85061.1 hypothetical protein GSbR_16610 [Geobacter sp. SVR]
MVKSFECVLLLMVLMGCYQLYCFSVTRKGFDRQRRCLVLGVLYLTLGSVGLVCGFPLAIGACVLLMMGLRLASYGLDRMDKQIYIDRYAGDDPSSANDVQ